MHSFDKFYLFIQDLVMVHGSKRCNTLSSGSAQLGPVVQLYKVKTGGITIHVQSFY